MKDEHNLRRSMRAAYNQMRGVAARLATNTTIESLSRLDMQILRGNVAEVNQRFHEFNAYRNALELPFAEDTGFPVSGVFNIGEPNLPPSSQSDVDRFFAGSHEQQDAITTHKPVDGMDERFGFAADAVPDDEPAKPHRRKRKPLPETVKFLPDTRDGRKDFQIEAGKAKMLYTTNIIAWDATNSCYCPPNGWTEENLRTFRRDYEVK